MSASEHPIAAGTSRRRALQYAVAGVGLALVPWPLSLAAGDRTIAEGGMRRRAIPATGEMLPVMGIGSSGSFASRTADNIDDLRTVMKRFVTLGGTLVDTSPTYGNAEVNIGRIAHDTGVRDELFMATKVHETGKKAGRDQMAQSNADLGGPIDLMQVHNLIDLETQWATLEQMKADGRVRYIGVTHYLTRAFDELEYQMSTKDMDFVQLNYSIMTPDAERRLLPLAADRGIAVIVNRAFNDGRFFSAVQGRELPDYAAEFDCASWAQFALKYVLANESVTAVIPATSEPAHLEDNMRAGYGRLPGVSMRERMRDTIASL